MLDVILANEGFWLNLIIPFVIGGILLLHSKGEYVFKEFIIQMGATLLLLGIVFSIFFRFSTDMYSTNYESSKVKQFEYLHSYTSTYTTVDSKGHITTHKQYHPPEYYVITFNDEKVSVNSNVWKNAKSDFGITRCRNIMTWGGSTSCTMPNIVIPTVVEHNEINYIKITANNIVLDKTIYSDINRSLNDGSLIKYPNLEDTRYGKIKLKRVLGYFYSDKANKMLINYATNNGYYKQVNPMIYTVDANVKGRGFVKTLSTYWKNAEKNDAILVLGLKDGKVEWSDTIAFTKNVDFLVNATKIYKGDKFDEELVNKFTSQINRYFERTPMSEYKYLEDEIALAWWAYVLIFLINLGVSFVLYRKFLNN